MEVQNPDLTWTPEAIVFCVEHNEYIRFSEPYTVDSILDRAVRGGEGGIDSSYNGLTADTISKETAWLYFQFAKGTLTGYDYANTGPGRGVSADRLQNAFWRLEDESYNTAKSSFYYDLVTNSATRPTDAAMNAALSRVRVVNPIALGSDGSMAQNHKQSQLYLVTPEPATIVVWSLLCVLGLATNRRPSKLA